MPVFKRGENLQQVFLPSTKDEADETERLWVTLDCSPLRTGDISNVEGDMAPGEASIQVITDRIREWNLQDTDGSTLPIELAIVKDLPIDDFRCLQEKVTDGGAELTATDAEKKTLNPTSSPEETINVRTPNPPPSS